MRTLVTDTKSKIGESITLQGWADTIRDHGKVTFIDLRDRTGLVQVVITSGETIHTEDVIQIEGVIKERPENMINPNLDTGTIEVEAHKITILNQTQPMPFPIDTPGYDIDENVRLKYRYIDLRRVRLGNILRLRSSLSQTFRRLLTDQDFVEIETPMLTKSTKEGARDFIVPSRFYPGKYYALPQSPQQYKQLLMTAGFERYFQLARCIRDEDLRADRGFEHTQVDIEVSFIDQQQLMDLVESTVKQAVTTTGGQLKDQKFPVFTYQQAIKQFGADKFDLRTEEEKKANILAFAWVVDFPFFKKVDQGDTAEVRDGKSGWTFTHNPFSQPQPQCLDDHMKGENLENILTAQYDLVCNGYEVGGGSIRAHNPQVLRQTFKIMGYTDQQIEDSIGHMLQAFALGTPPHGGIALGLDRLVMLLAGETSLKETIAFPMSSTGRTAVMDAPSEVSKEQLAELGLTPQTIDSSQSVTDQIQQKLNNLGIKFELEEHEPVLTSQEAAKVRGVPEDQGAKALVMLADKQPIMLVLPGSKKADTKALKATYGYKDVEMAPKELVEKTTNVQIGGVPPFGSLFGLTTYVDESLGKNKQISFNAGDRAKSITITYEDYIRAEQPEIGSFAK